MSTIASLPAGLVELADRVALRLMVCCQVSDSLAGLGRLAMLVIAIAMGGCAALPSQVERPVSYAGADVAETGLGRIAAASTPENDRALSGFRLLPEGDEAFAARIALIRRAEKTIDVQYYLIADDRTGREFLRALAGAAARGVRVRVLVDDLYATGEDALFAGLASRPNVEVRLFNPLPVRGGSFATRLALSLNDFARINHRMHNKLFIADGSFAITGGRNIADEYFDRSGAANFIDMDLLSSGAVVAELAQAFDRFWNSPYVYPVQSLARAARGESDAANRHGDGAAAADGTAADSTGSDADAGATIAAELARGHVAQRFARARVLADAPAEIADNDPGRADSPVMRAHLELLASARTSVLVASPYFVPGADGLAALREARAHDVRFTIMTNSLATTDEPLVHFGYARYRLALLKLGVALHELMPMPEAAAGDEAGEHHGASLGRLHAKLIVVDDRWVSIGSMNMDRRSARCNTEAAIVIDDPLLAGEVSAFLERGRLSGSYALRLGDGGKRVEWIGRGGAAAVKNEPRPLSGRGLKPRLASFFVSEDML
jgi:putative cardiolipin synthase